MDEISNSFSLQYEVMFLGEAWLGSQYLQHCINAKECVDR